MSTLLCKLKSRLCLKQYTLWANDISKTWAGHLGVQVRDGKHEPHKHKLAEVVADLPVEEEQQEAVPRVGIVGAQEKVDACIQHVVPHRHQFSYLLCPIYKVMFSGCIKAEVY